MQYASQAEAALKPLFDQTTDVKANKRQQQVAIEMLCCALRWRHSLSPAEFRQIVAVACGAAGPGASKDVVDSVVTALMEDTKKQQGSSLSSMFNDMAIDTLPKKGGTRAVMGTSTKRTARVVKFAQCNDDDAVEESSTNTAAMNGTDLTSAFESLGLVDENGPMGNTQSSRNAPGGLNKMAPPPSTSRIKKHKSRIGLMHGSTPAPKSARKPLGGLDDMPAAPASVMKPPATAPRSRKPPATPGAPQTVPAALRRQTGAGALASNNSNEVLGTKMGAVVLVLDAQLQGLPWESIGSLKSQR